MFVDFFWNGQHWLRESVLYLQLSEGGQGLRDIKSKVAAFRLQTAQRLLYHQSQTGAEIACVLLKRVGWMNLDRHPLFNEFEGGGFKGLPSFYTSVLHAWQNIYCLKRAV